MGYSEAADIEQHKEDIQRMLDSLGDSIDFPVRRALDVGGGGGMHSSLMVPLVEKIYCTDLWDQNTRYRGEFVKLLSEKMERNGCPSPVGKLEFHAVDAMSMPYRDNYFDLVVSFNAFEHIPDPSLAFDEIVRVTKPGGLIFITFDPIWTADSGSHFYGRIGEPWRHLLCSDDAYVHEMKLNHATDEECSDYRNGMNRLRLHTHRMTFSRWERQLEFLVEQEWSGCSAPENMSHANFRKCIAKGYSEEELLFRGMRKVIRKPALELGSGPVKGLRS